MTNRILMRFWIGRGIRDYERAVEEEGLRFPRDTYVANFVKHMEEKFRERQDREGQDLRLKKTL